MQTYFWQRKFFLALVFSLFLTSCFKSGDDLDPNNEGKARFNVANVSAKSESESIQFNLSLNREVSEDVELSYTTQAGTATAGVDYTETSGSILIPKGSTTVVITVPVVDDALVETDETVNLVISGENRRITLNSTTAEATILDNDTYPVATIADVSNTESIDATFTVTLDKTYPEDITIDYTTSDGTAISGTDYTAASSSVTILANTLSNTISIPVNDDTLDENDESFAISLSNPVNVILGNSSAVATIEDDDGTPNLDVADTTVAEGSDIVFTVSIPTASALPITFDYASSDGTALTGFDYTGATGSGSIPAGSTSTTISISGLEDALSEDTETLDLTISNVTNGMLGDATGTGSITDNDPLPSLSINDITLTENNNAVFTVTMNAVAGRDVSFDWLTTAGTATHDGYPDFTQVTTTTETISAGSTTATLTVTIADDSMDEPDENFRVDLSNPVNTNISDASGQATIQDNDDPPTANWSTASVALTEGQFGQQNSRIQLTFSNSSRSSNLIDFPVLVRLNGSRIDYSKTNDDGSNIRFYDSDNTTPLSYEIEKWDETGESLVWVKVPQIDAGSDTDHIFMYYGNMSLTDAQNPEDVWNSNYIGVYHMNSLVDGYTQDSSSLNKHAMNFGASSNTTGQIGGSFYFNPSDVMTMGHGNYLPIGNSAVTACGWISQASIGNEFFFGYGNDGAGSGFFIGTDSDSKIYAGSFNGTTYNSRGATTLSPNTWYYICQAYAPGNYLIYLNGAQDGSKNTNFNLNGRQTRIGSNANQSNFLYQGHVDELRISNIKRSADWINAEYASMAGNLITYGTEEAPATVTVTLNLSELSGYDVVIPYSISGTSTSSDHTAVDGSLSIDAETGTSASFTYEILNDSIAESPETLIITMGSPTYATAGGTSAQTVTITDDEENPVVNFSAASSKTTELSWWNSSWLSRIPIDINNPFDSTDIKGFPILVKLDSSRIDYSLTQDAGQDLRFTNYNGTIELPFEIEKWDEAGTSYVWVRLPEIDQPNFDNRIYLYYNNSGASDGQNKASVWGKDYTTVLHMNSLVGSTGYQTTATNVGSTPTASGVLGDAYSFDGSTQRLEIDNIFHGPLNLDEKTYCMWVNHQSPGSNQDFFSIESEPNAYPGTNAGMCTNTNNSFCTWGETSDPGKVNDTFDGTNFRHVCWNFDGANAIKLYVDGFKILHKSSSLNNQLNNYTIGNNRTYNNYSGGKWFNGLVDEVRISRANLTDEWIQLEYLSQKDSLNSYGAAESYSANHSHTISIEIAETSPNTITVPFTLSGTSTNGSDHNLSDGNITITPGNSNGSISFNITDDSSLEGDETIILTMGSPTNATAGSINTHSVTILDNELDPVVNFSVAGQTVPEATGSVSVNFELNKNADSAITVPYTITGKANNPDDHDAVDGSIVIGSGTKTGSFTINIVNDALDEFSEDIIISIGSVVGATVGELSTHTIYIADDDTQPTISISSPTANENAGTLDFVVSVDAASGKQIEFDYSTASITALSEYPYKNYQHTEGLRSRSTQGILPAGDLSVNISVPLLDNN